MLSKKLKLSTPTYSGEILKGVSQYFDTNVPSKTIAQQILDYEKNLSGKLKELTFGNPVAYVYNPLEYAFDPHANFVNTYCTGTKKILFLGLNPGPWGMCQTGIPFGEIKAVKEWLKITGTVSKPDIECPKKLITGFDCLRSEESGKRFYGLFKVLCGTPENFFKDSFVYNWCPLAMMAKESLNITPQDYKGEVKKKLEEYCGEALINVLKVLNTGIILAIGRYTQTQAEIAIKKYQIDNIKIIYMPHPSPRVVGNENWPEKAKKVLKDNNLLKYFTLSV